MSGQLLINQFNYDSVNVESDPHHSGGEGGNCLDGSTYTAWKPNSADNFAQLSFNNGENIIINALGFSGVKVPDDFAALYIYAADNPEYTDQVILFHLDKSEITSGILLFISTNATPYTYYRVLAHNLNNDIIDFELSNLILGEYIDLPNGIAAPYTPPKLSAKTEILNNKTMGGHFVGRSVLSGQYDFIIKNKNVTPEWIEENWLDLHKQISEKPFMYLWDDSRPQDAVFCWTKGDIPPPKYDNQCYFSFSIPCNGFIEND